MKKIEHPLLYKEFLKREKDELRAPYNPELQFYDAIKKGDIKRVMHFCEQPLSEKEGLGVLSDDPLQSIKYHFVITAAMVSRYCIEGGMDFSVAYNLSDFYIQGADKCVSVEEVSLLHRDMCKDYAGRMKRMHKEKIYSRHVAECMDYIYDHLHIRITIDALAKKVGLSPSYLSRLFKQETGMAVSDYIRRKKVETAKSMLAYSDYSVAEIAAILAFPSHSYFSEIFRKDEQMTPGQYRASHFRKLEVFP